MNVWILQTGEPLQIDAGAFRNMRAINLSNMLVSMGHKVRLISSNFDHITKTQRTPNGGLIRVNSSLEICLLPSRGYKKHIGISRVIDHWQLALQLRKFLRNGPIPDVAFVGFPPIELSWVFARWLKENRVPFLIDVKDAWPELYVWLFPKWIHTAIKGFLAPIFLMRKFVFMQATGICSISFPFLSWSLEITNRSLGSKDLVAPLTSAQTIPNNAELTDAISWWDGLGMSESENFRCYFVGSLNGTFNFEPVLEAAKATNIEFVICGDGPLREQLMEKFKALSNVKFPGWISSSQAHVLALNSSLALGPIGNGEDFTMSIPNKFYDALRHGKPILTSGNGLPKDFVEVNRVGWHYEDGLSLITILKKLQTDTTVMKEVSDRAVKLYKDKYDGDNVYRFLANHLTRLEISDNFDD
jgi:glycosyltransferase involved in cell wall biosynthesis